MSPTVSPSASPVMSAASWPIVSATSMTDHAANSLTSRVGNTLQADAYFDNHEENIVEKAKSNLEVFMNQA